MSLNLSLFTLKISSVSFTFSAPCCQMKVAKGHTLFDKSNFIYLHIRMCLFYATEISLCFSQKPGYKSYT